MFSFSLRRFHNLFIAPALLIFAVSAHAQNPTITLTGHVFYSTGQPAAGATVTLTKNVYIVNPNEVSYDHTAADSGGSFTFQVEARCGVEYDVQATSSEIVDDEPLPPSGTNSISGCVLGNTDLGTLTIARPQQITLGGHVTDQTGVPVQGITVTMTRTKYDLIPNVVTTATTIYDETVATDANNQFQLTMPDGRLVTALTPDFYGQIVKNGDGSYTVTFKDGRVHQFNASGKLLSLTDRNGNQTLLTYANGNLSSITDPFARVLTVTTNASQRISSISDALGTIATYTYGGSQELLSVTYADNSGYQFSYP